MPFRSKDLETIATTKEVVIETKAGKRAFRTVIWVVADGESIYVRSVRGESGRWYQRALANAEVAIHVGNRKIPARAVHIRDTETVDLVSDGFRQKYRKGRSLDAMVRPEVLGTTLRLEPVTDSS